MKLLAFMSVMLMAVLALALHSSSVVGAPVSALPVPTAPVPVPNPNPDPSPSPIPIPNPNPEPLPVPDCSSGSVMIGGTCVTCTPGTYANVSISSCVFCPNGTYSYSSGSTECTPCGSGANSSFVLGSTYCNGTTNNICPAGYESDDRLIRTKLPSATLLRAEVAVPANAVPVVPSGPVSPIPSWCIPCRVGYYNDLADGYCRACRWGTYSDTPGSLVCSVCVGFNETLRTKGPYTSCLSGAPVSSPNSSAPGFYVSQNSTDPVPCAAGFAQPRSNSTGCFPCPKNTFSSAGSAQCTPCADGQSTFGRIAQSACLKRNINIECSAGSVFSPVFRSCISCFRSQRYDPISKSCRTCPVGKMNLVEGGTGCFSCAPGSFINGSSDVCVKCQPGFSSPSNSNGSSSCTPCASGFSSAGGRVCSACNSTSIASTTGSAACTPCPAGKVANRMFGGTECVDADSQAIKAIRSSAESKMRLKFHFNQEHTAFTSEVARKFVDTLLDLTGLPNGTIAVTSVAPGGSNVVVDVSGGDSITPLQASTMIMEDLSSESSSLLSTPAFANYDASTGVTVESTTSDPSSAFSSSASVVFAVLLATLIALFNL